MGSSIYTHIGSPYTIHRPDYTGSSTEYRTQVYGTLKPYISSYIYRFSVHFVVYFSNTPTNARI